MTCPLDRALLTLALCATTALAQARPAPAEATILARAREACTRGDQRTALACGIELREHDPDDVCAYYVIGVVTGSLGPCFSRIAAEQAFARVVSLLGGDDVARLRGLPGVSSRTDLAAITATVARWRRELDAGERLLLVPDPAAAQRLADRLGQRISAVEAWAASERARLERARKQKAEGEKALHRERTRKRRAGELFADVQPIVDKIHASERSIQACTRRLEEFDAQLASLRAQLDRASDGTRGLR